MMLVTFSLRNCHLNLSCANHWSHLLVITVTTLGNEEMVSEWTKAYTSVTGMVSNSSLIWSSASVDLVKSGLCIQDAPNWYLSIEITRLKCQLLKRQFLFFFFLTLKKNNLFWRLITLQYCSGFCHTLTCISHGCTCVPHPEPRLPPPSPSHPSRLSQCIGFECPVWCIELGLVI